MQILISILSLIILLGCSGESTSHDRVAEKNISKKVENKESNVLGLFGKDEKENYVISSPLQGLLRKGDKPLVNTKITRYIEWTGFEGEKVDEFYTDEKGRFNIPIYEETLSLGKLAQFVGKALLIVELNEEEIPIWVVAKFDGEMYSDLSGPLNELVCDIKSDRLSLDMPRSMISTRCRWQSMPKFK